MNNQNAHPFPHWMYPIRPSSDFLGFNITVPNTIILIIIDQMGLL